MKWLAPQDTHLNFDTFQAWNKQHPEAVFSIAFRASEWPMIDSWDTPTFYFFLGDQVVDRVVGWPREGNRSALLAALHRIGL